MLNTKEQLLDLFVKTAEKHDRRETSSAEVARELGTVLETMASYMDEQGLVIAPISALVGEENALVTTGDDDV